MNLSNRFGNDSCSTWNNGRFADLRVSARPYRKLDGAGLFAVLLLEVPFSGVFGADAPVECEYLHVEPNLQFPCVNRKYFGLNRPDGLRDTRPPFSRLGGLRSLGLCDLSPSFE